MGGRNARYDRAQLLELLQKRCPEGLARLPPQASFTFKTEDDHTYLHIGYWHGDRVWVRFHEKKDKWMYFKCGNWLGSMTRDFETNRIAWLSPISYLTETGLIYYPWTDRIRAVILFLFVWCGQKAEFEDFRWGDGFKALVNALGKIPAPITANISEEESEQNEGESSNESITGNDPGTPADGNEVTARSSEATPPTGETKAVATNVPQSESAANKKRSHDEFLDGQKD